MTYLLTCTDRATGKTWNYEYTDEELGWSFRAPVRWVLINGGVWNDGAYDWKVASIH